MLRWREQLLAVALLSLGASVLLASLVVTVWDSPWAAPAATAVIGIGMLAPTVWAFTRSRPVGLLRFRALDLLYGVMLGVFLRMLQGWIASAGGTPAAFPSFVRLDGGLTPSTLIVEAVAPVVAAPVIEEFFFRAVVLVSLYTALRRPFGKFAAGLVSALASTALFVLLHGIWAGPDAGAIVALSALGIACALLVLLTGRIWAAVLAHAVYNGAFVALAVLGTVLG